VKGHPGGLETHPGAMMTHLEEVEVYLGVGPHWCPTV